MKPEEQLKLSEIEAQLIAEDPGLHLKLRDGAGHHRLQRLTWPLATGTGVVITVLSLVVDYPTGVLAGLAFAGLGLWRGQLVRSLIAARAAATKDPRRPS